MFFLSLGVFLSRVWGIFNPNKYTSRIYFYSPWVICKTTVLYLHIDYGYQVHTWRDAVHDNMSSRGLVNIAKSFSYMTFDQIFEEDSGNSKIFRTFWANFKNVYPVGVCMRSAMKLIKIILLVLEEHGAKWGR